MLCRVTCCMCARSWTLSCARPTGSKASCSCQPQHPTIRVGGALALALVLELELELALELELVGWNLLQAKLLGLAAKLGMELELGHHRPMTMTRHQGRQRTAVRHAVAVLGYHGRT